VIKSIATLLQIEMNFRMKVVETMNLND